MSHEGGGDDSAPVSWVFDSLGYAQDSAPLYLNVYVWPTNYEKASQQWATVKVNGNVVKAYCTPEESCGTEWFACVSELDISGYKQEALGGSLTVEVSSTGVGYGPCDHNSKPLYTSMYLREALPTGEPTGQPTDIPSGQPSGQPSDQPSTQPSSQPSMQPSVQPTGQPSVQPSSQPSDQPSAQPTSQPSMHPSGQPSDQPSGQPTNQPSGQPSSQPTEQPTVQPSGQPSDEPTGQPSSHPTYLYPLSLSHEGGGDDSAPVSWVFDSLGYAQDSAPLYLNVYVWPTNYEKASQQWATVKVNGNVVKAYCTPEESCGTEWFACVSELDISGYKQEALGGSLTVEVSSTGVGYGPCDHNSKPLYTSMYLREALPTGEPTGQPTNIPSGQPSGQPSDQPSTQPSSQPSMQPSVQPTGQPSVQPSSQPSDQPSAQPTSQPSMQPSGQPSDQPSGQPTSQPTTQPTDQPSGQPSDEPTGQPSTHPSSFPSTQPSAEPSAQPSSCPSSVPSSHPTLTSPIGKFYTAGGSDSQPIVWSLPGIGFANNTLPLYLSVDIWPTNYAIVSEQWSTVKVNGISLSEFCSPKISCGTSWYNCLENVNVADLISERHGGYIVVEVSSTGVSSGPCDKNDHPLYARMLLQETKPLEEKVSIWAVIGSLIGGIAILIVIIWLLFVKYCRKRYAAVYGTEGIYATRQRDVESCVENEDCNVGINEYVKKSIVSVAPVIDPEKVVPIETDLEMQEPEPSPEKSNEEISGEEKEQQVDVERHEEQMLQHNKKKKLFQSYKMSLDPEDQKLIDDEKEVRKKLSSAEVTHAGNISRRPPPDGPKPDIYKGIDEKVIVKNDDDKVARPNNENGVDDMSFVDFDD